ncbi:flavin reductase, partial [bacterium]|nr:flavin reductase [bacterium]
KETAAEFDSEISEFEAVGIDALESACVKPPRVANSLAQFECRLNRVIHLAEGPAGANIVIGDIVQIHVSDSVISEPGKIDYEKLDAIGRMGGASYTRTTDRFDL